MFRGSAPAKIDDKGRLKVPTDFRRWEFRPIRGCAWPCRTGAKLPAGSRRHRRMPFISRPRGRSGGRCGRIAVAASSPSRVSRSAGDDPMQRGDVGGKMRKIESHAQIVTAARLPITFRIAPESKGRALSSTLRLPRAHRHSPIDAFQRGGLKMPPGSQRVVPYQAAQKA